MIIDSKEQLTLLLSCMLMGFLSGVFYDFLRAFRRKLKSTLFTFLADLLFCLVFFICLFILGYTAGGGEQRLYDLLLTMVGAGLYFAGLSPLFLKVFGKFAGLLAKIFHVVTFPFRFMKKIIKKLWNFLKNCFHSAKNCYTIKCTRNNAEKESSKPDSFRKGNTHEAEKGWYYY